MKKNLLILAVAALAFASCSNDETVAVNNSGGNEISFRPLVTGVTRASANGPLAGSFAEGDVIDVYADLDGTKFFQADFTKGAGATGFTSGAEKYYWPSSFTNLTFTAIYGAAQSTSTVGEITAFAPDDDVANQKDVLVARHVSTAKTATVPLNFRHVLSQIVVKVKNTNPGLKITIKGFQVGYVDKTGTFQLDRTSAIANTDYQEEEVDGNAGNLTTSVTLIPAAKWANTAATAASSCYTQTLASDKVFTGTNTDEIATLGSSWLLLPQSQTAATDYANDDANVTVEASTAPDLAGSFIAVKMVIESYNGSATTGTLATERWCCWPVNITWNPGYKYTYTINVGDGGYEPADVDGTAGLDTVLGDVIIFSPDCTIDYWVVSD